MRIANAATAAGMIANMAEELRELCSLSALPALRDTLLPKLISGELQVKDAERFLEKRGL